MFFKEITLKRNGLSYTLIHFVFPWIQRFNNFCPHFWLTIAAAFLFPIALPLRAICFCLKKVVLGSIKVLEVLGEELDEWVIKSWEAKFFSLPAEELAKWLEWNTYDYDANGWDHLPLPVCERKRFHKIRKLYFKLVGNLDYDLKQRLRERVKAEKAELNYEIWKQELRARDDAYRKKQELIARRREERLSKIEEAAKKSAIKIMVFGKIAAVVVILLLCAFILYHLYFFFGWAGYWIAYYWITINWQIVGQVCLIICFLGIASLILAGIIYGGIKLVGSMPKGSIRKSAWWCVFTQKILKPLGEGFTHGVLATFTWLDNYLPKFGKGVSSFFGFFWHIFKAWKDKNCPAIIWKD